MPERKLSNVNGAFCFLDDIGFALCAMKTPCTASVFLFAFLSPSFGASITVADPSTTLPGVAVETLSLLLDAGLPLKNIGNARFSLEAKNFHCDQYARGALDASDPVAGIPTIKCRIESENRKDTHTGRPFAEGRAMDDLLQKIQDSNVRGYVHFSDCAMGGYCGTFVKSIICTIDSTIQNYTNGGRWSCTFVDGQ